MMVDVWHREAEQSWSRAVSRAAILAFASTMGKGCLG